jgi:peptidase E
LLEHQDSGSVTGLLAMWRLHDVDTAMRAAWQAGVVLTGISAGSICWHIGGAEDSFGPDLRPFTDGLALVSFSNGVHYDSEPQRRPLLQRLIAEGTLPTATAPTTARVCCIAA